MISGPDGEVRWAIGIEIYFARRRAVWVVFLDGGGIITVCSSQRSSVRDRVASIVVSPFVCSFFLSGRMLRQNLAGASSKCVFVVVKAGHLLSRPLFSVLSVDTLEYVGNTSFVSLSHSRCCSVLPQESHRSWDNAIYDYADMRDLEIFSSQI